MLGSKFESYNMILMYITSYFIVFGSIFGAHTVFSTYFAGFLHCILWQVWVKYHLLIFIWSNSSCLIVISGHMPSFQHTLPSFFIELGRKFRSHIIFSTYITEFLHCVWY